VDEDDDDPADYETFVRETSVYARVTAHAFNKTLTFHNNADNEERSSRLWWMKLNKFKKGNESINNVVVKSNGNFARYIGPDFKFIKSETFHSGNYYMVTKEVFSPDLPKGDFLFSPLFLYPLLSSFLQILVSHFLQAYTRTLWTCSVSSTLTTQTQETKKRG
jgi:hypothetical protein